MKPSQRSPLIFTQEKMILKKANGFSVIEVMVVIGIMSVVMLAFMQMTVSGQSDVAALQSKMGQLILAQDIRFKTSQSNLCMPALKSTAYKGGAAPMDFEFDLGGGRVVKKDADLNPTDNVVVKQFQLVNPTTVTTLTKLPGSSVTATGGSVISGNLEIVTAGGRGSNREFKRMNIGRINLLVNNASTIVDCNSTDIGTTADTASTPDSAGSCGTSPPTATTDWPAIRSGVCASLTYPMTKSQTVQVCSKGFSKNLVYSDCGKYKNGTAKPSDSGISIKNFGPFSSQSACEATSPTSGMVLVQHNYSTTGSNGSGYSNTTYYDMCIGGKWITITDTDGANADSAGDGGSGDGGSGE